LQRLIFTQGGKAPEATRRIHGQAPRGGREGERQLGAPTATLQLPEQFWQRYQVLPAQKSSPTFPTPSSLFSHPPVNQTMEQIQVKIKSGFRSVPGSSSPQGSTSVHAGTNGEKRQRVAGAARATPGYASLNHPNYNRAPTL